MNEGSYREGIRAIIPFARTLGAARAGPLHDARVNSEVLRMLHSRLVKSSIEGQYNWTDKVESMLLAFSAWIILADGRIEEAVERAREFLFFVPRTGFDSRRA